MARPTLTQTIKRLRSQRSTNTPAVDPNRIAGARPAIITPAVARAEPVRRYSSNGSAAMRAQSPIIEIRPPIHSSRKSRSRSNFSMFPTFIVSGVANSKGRHSQMQFSHAHPRSRPSN